MERKVLFRDRQESDPADMSNIEEFTDQSLQHIISDAITTEKQIVGLQVTKKSATEIEIAPGRLWDGTTGKVYRLDEAQTISIFSSIPIQDKKYLAVSVYGQEADTDIQPRDFLIDLQTSQTEPRAVAMETARQIVSTITPGPESSDPQVPVAPTGYTIIASVLLDTGGVVEVDLADNKRLPRLFDVDQRVAVVEGWKDMAEPRISTLASDMASLADRVGKMSNDDLNRRISEVSGDVARVKNKLNLPATFASYDLDDFANAEQSQTDDTEYHAKTEEGLSFPNFAEDESQIALFNPYESAVNPTYRDLGFLLPLFSEVVRLKTSGYAGDLSISQYQSQSFAIKNGLTPVTVINYGPTKWVPAWWLRSDYWKNYYWYRWYPWYYGTPYGGAVPTGYEVLENNGLWVKIKYFWKDTVNVPYQYIDTVTTNISGACIGQTFLNSQNGWLTKVGLYFTQRDVNGVVNVILCECQNGVPDVTKTIASTSLAAANLNAYPLATNFTFQTPAYLKAGTRYALVIVTTGNHKVAVVNGTEFTQGTIYYSMDEEYYQGDFTKDLMMTFYYAKFSNPRTTVNLQPASLSGGIADFAIAAQMIVPETCELHFEYQKDGKWYAIDETTAEQLLGLPAMVAMRAVFVGSSDLMPSLVLTRSTLTVSRPDTSFKHISTLRTLGAATAQVDVQVLLRDFVADDHTCIVRLKHSSTVINSTSVTDKVEEDGIRRTAHFTGISPTISDYRVIIEGTTNSALSIFHVGERMDIAQ